MEAMTYYLKVNIAFAVLFAVYALTMRRETGFNGRRAWLLMAPLAALSIPFVHTSHSATTVPPSGVARRNDATLPPMKSCHLLA